MKPKTLPYQGYYCEGGSAFQFLYGHDKQRRKTSFYENGNLGLEKHFVGLYEKDMLSEAYNFYCDNGEKYLAEHTSTTIEMSSPRNGRVYDPILGRMLMPDRFVQDALFSQGYSRYSSVWNNPLRYTDPSGDFVVVGFEAGSLVGMIAGGTGNVGVLGADKGSDATFREYAQKFVSGAINSYVGPSIFANDMFGHKVEYMRMANGSYFGGSKATAKAWRAGWLNQASDFAHSSQEAFQSRSFMERVMMFGGAGASNLIGGSLSRYSDYFIQQTIHSTFSNDPSYLPLNYEYSNRKLFIQVTKNLFYNLSY